MLLRVALVALWMGALGECQGEERVDQPAQSWSWEESHRLQDKRAPSGFFGVRGKKDELQQELEEEDYALDKRGPPLMGFQGVRGKKAPSMGFMGMRGKKDYAAQQDYPGWLLDYEEFDKRAPSGFFGVRGKKGPSSGFFGMRGKKGPSNSGFFGMRGKKGPSGFLGVRGKKDSSAEDIDQLLNRLRESPPRDDELEDMMDSRVKRFVGDVSPSDEVAKASPNDQHQQQQNQL